MESKDINKLNKKALPFQGERGEDLLEELEQIPIPEGLEERLSAKIDEWDAASRHKLPSLEGNSGIEAIGGFAGGRAGGRLERGHGWRILSLAASFILVCGIGLYFALAPTNKGTIDTYDDPNIACLEAQNALQLLATNLNKGMAQYEAVNAKSRQAEEILNKQLKKLN